MSASTMDVDAGYAWLCARGFVPRQLHPGLRRGTMLVEYIQHEGWACFAIDPRQCWVIPIGVTRCRSPEAALREAVVRVEALSALLAGAARDVQHTLTATPFDCNACPPQETP